MVIYEVNLTINQAIFADYYAWLLDHIKQILNIDGFIKAEIGMVQEQIADNKQLRVSYSLQSMLALENYLQHFAPAMRAEGINKFGDGFSATRRVLVEPLVIV